MWVLSVESLSPYDLEFGEGIAERKKVEVMAQSARKPYCPVPSCQGVVSGQGGDSKISRICLFSVLSDLAGHEAEMSSSLDLRGRLLR